jgi:hypothetical protein
MAKIEHVVEAAQRIRVREGGTAGYSPYLHYIARAHSDGVGLRCPASAASSFRNKDSAMHAITVRDRDAGIGGLSLTDMPYPHAIENDVIVRVHAAGFTRGELDWPGTWSDRAGRDRTPSVPGHELSGVVAELGYGTTGLTVGQRVFGLTDWTRNGSLAEYAAVEARNLAPLPADVDHTVAAALPISGLTAWQGLFDHGRLTAGQTILIHGAAGGVGSIAVQLAREAGARVIGTGRAADRDTVLGLGADAFLDLRYAGPDELTRSPGSRGCAGPAAAGRLPGGPARAAGVRAGGVRPGRPAGRQSGDLHPPIRRAAHRRLGADTPADALAICLDTCGEARLADIARLLGVGEDQARRDLGTLVFYDPESGRLLPAAEYLSGNIRARLRAAEAAALDEPRFAVNVAELRKVLPGDPSPARSMPG